MKSKPYHIKPKTFLTTFFIVWALAVVSAVLSSAVGMDWPSFVLGSSLVAAIALLMTYEYLKEDASAED